MRHSNIAQTSTEASRRESGPSYVVEGVVLGDGSGSAVNAFIAMLAPIRDRISGAVAASSTSREALRKVGICVLDLNDVESGPGDIDGGDEIGPSFAMIKGGGGANTREDHRNRLR